MWFILGSRVTSRKTICLIALRNNKCDITHITHNIEQIFTRNCIKLHNKIE